ncbi:MAG: hypothetical protein ABL891_06220 [Burkholderiales bacterium]
MDGTINLTLKFAPLARRPDIRRFGRRWDVCVEIDGVLRVFQEGPRHTVTVSPGPHKVTVWFRGAGIAILGRWFRYGLRSLNVTVKPGAALQVTYEGSAFWHMGGEAKLVLG